MRYFDLEITIEKKVGENYPIRISSNKKGHTSGSMSLNLDEFQEALLSLGDDDAKLDDVKKVGTLLFEKLFQDKVNNIYQQSIGQINADKEEGVRISLRIDPPEIAALPWELIYDEDRDSFLAMSVETPLTRYLEVFEPIRELATEPPIKVLLVIPNRSELDDEGEKKIVVAAIEELQKRIPVKIKIIEGTVTQKKIDQALLEDKYHIFHFIGHGKFSKDKACLIINNEAGKDDELSSFPFSLYFESYPSIKLIILNSCKGAKLSPTQPLVGMAPELIKKGVPAVVAMQYSIPDDVAVVFADGFYRKLCASVDRGRVDMAVSHARKRICQEYEDTYDFAIPVLFMRSDTGIIFSFPADEETVAEDDKPSIQTGPEEVTWFDSVFQRIVGRTLSKSEKDLLRDIRETHKKNIDVLHQNANDEQAVKEIKQEKQQIIEVEDRIWPWPKTALVFLFTSLLILFASQVKFFNLFYLDNWTRDKVVEYGRSHGGSYKIDSNKLATILVENQTAPTGSALTDVLSINRQPFAKLVAALHRGGAKVVVLDIFFKQPSLVDDEFARTVTEAELGQPATQVFVGVESVVNGRPATELPEKLREAFEGHWGIIDFAKEQDFAKGIVIAQSLTSDAIKDSAEAEIPVVPSIALQAVMQYEFPNQDVKPFLDWTELEVRLRRGGAEGEILKTIPVEKIQENKAFLLIDFAKPDMLASVRSSYSDLAGHLNDTAYLRAKFQNKIVVVGATDVASADKDLKKVSPSETIHGAEIHLSAISNMLGTPPQELSSFYRYLVIVLMMLASVLLQTRFRNVLRYKLPLKLKFLDTTLGVPLLPFIITIIYLLVALLLYQEKRLLLDITYPVAALFLSYGIMALARKKAVQH